MFLKRPARLNYLNIKVYRVRNGPKQAPQDRKPPGEEGLTG